MRYALLVFLLYAGNLAAERITVPLRDPSRPATIKISAVNTSIHVKSHAAREVVVETDASASASRPGPNGMRQILMGMHGLSIEEENNVVTVKPTPNTRGPIVVLVPEQSSVTLSGVNSREIRVEGVSGEINAQSTNGSVHLVDVAGPVVAHSLNGEVQAVLRSVPEGKPMSFSTLYGRIDVTLPASTKADLKISNSRGDTFSDFEMQLTTSVNRTDSGREQGPRYRLNLDSTVVGRINGGGPEFTFRSHNGRIYIRKGK